MEVSIGIVVKSAIIRVDIRPSAYDCSVRGEDNGSISVREHAKLD